MASQMCELEKFYAFEGGDIEVPVEGYKRGGDGAVPPASTGEGVIPPKSNGTPAHHVLAI